jgi:hypothetical protein
MTTDQVFERAKFNITASVRQDTINEVFDNIIGKLTHLMFHKTDIPKEVSEILSESAKYFNYRNI